MNNLFGYKQRDTWLNQTTGTAKLIGFLALTTIGMISYDPRFLLGLGILAILLLRRAKIKYREYAFMLKLVLFFATSVRRATLWHAPCDSWSRVLGVDTGASLL